MASMRHKDSGRMYSWWWDSHISPKNSKWLQENLTDMDSKVKAMIKLIEEDADSFARRAEMYYKKRPELMKLVEEFYRAYRALAERYDHATGVIRQAHRTMTEAFPNQVPLMLGDDSPAGSDPRTPEISTPARALFEPDDLHKDALGLSSPHLHSLKKNGALSEDSDSLPRQKGLKQFNDLFGSGDQANITEGRVRKGLNFHDVEDKEQRVDNKEIRSFKAQARSEDEHVGEPAEILLLKETLAKLKAEKEADLIKYQESLDKLSKLESEITRAEEDSKQLNERASKAETEALSLKNSLTKLEAEKEVNLKDYRVCLERISNLEIMLSRAQDDAKELNERTDKAESEAQSLKDDLAKVSAEKDTALDQYMQSLEMISDLENKLRRAEEDATSLTERAEMAEREIETLKQSVSKLTEDKETAVVRYQQSLQTISDLEHKLRCAEEEAQRLSAEIDDGATKLKGAEEQCLLLEKSNQTLHSELETLMLKMETQSEELTEKQKELGRLWTCIQEERLRFVEAETAFQTLQHLHSQTQEELRSMALELQKRAQISRDVEAHNQSLLEEVLKVKEENKSLNELNVSSALSMKDMQSEISRLNEARQKLEEEVELRVDQRNALQQEIYCLKEELNDLNKKHLSILEQLHSVGLNSESLGASIKQLQDENSSLKENIERERSEKEALLQKFETLEQLLEKNSVLENSLSDLSVELETVRAKMKSLEESCESLLKEKSMLVGDKANLVIQVQVASENLMQLSEKNTILENSLSDAHDELQGLKAKSKSLEDSCQLLVSEKVALDHEKDGLVSQLEATKMRLEDMEKQNVKLEEKCSALEKERESTLSKVEELQLSLDVEKQQHATLVQVSETRLAGMETEKHLLMEECRMRKQEFDKELDKALESQVEIFILRRCAQELEQKNITLVIQNQKLSESCRLSEQFISELKQINLEKQMEGKTLFDQCAILREGIFNIMKSLDLVPNYACEDTVEQDGANLNCIASKIEDDKLSLWKSEDDNHQKNLEILLLNTLLGQLTLQAADLDVQNDKIIQELDIKAGHLSVLQSQAHKLHEVNEELRSKVSEGIKKEEALTIQVENLLQKSIDMQTIYQDLQRENTENLEGKRRLAQEVVQLNEKNRFLEEYNHGVCGDMISVDILSLVSKIHSEEKSSKIEKLIEDLKQLGDVNSSLTGRLNLTERKLEEVKIENGNLKESLHKAATELKMVTTLKDQLTCEIERRKSLLCQNELELQQAEEMIIFAETEKLVLQNTTEDLMRGGSKSKIITDKLSADNEHLRMESRCFSQTNQMLEVELQQLREEQAKLNIQEENLHSELKKIRDETELWESEAAVFFGELQMSTLCQDLYKEKVHELSEVVNRLKERLSILVGENEGLKTELDSYGAGIISLSKCISSLENNTSLHAKLKSTKSKDIEDAEVANHLCGKFSNEDQKVPHLRLMKDRIQAIEEVVLEMEQLVVQENLNVRLQLEAAEKQIEELKTENSLHRRYIKPTAEISEPENGVLTKDIMLDQISECSSRGISRREQNEAENRSFEVWEAADQDGSIGLTVAKAKKTYTPVAEEDANLYRTKSMRKQKGGRPTEGVRLEKEPSVDKLEVSKRFVEPRQEGSKRKVLDRLNSDVQKLTNLQITVQDLRRKLDITEKSKRGKAVIECETLKGQLEEAEEAILKLFDLNGKLARTVEDSSSPKAKPANEIEEHGDVSRRIPEQARRMSEKIGRLQLEVQKLQFVLLKLDDEKEGRDQSRIAETRRRILLRDYLYGGVRRNHRRKKAPFCACVQPSTTSD